MAVITTSKATERLTKRLQRAGLNYWIGESSGDAWGKYLIFAIGGKCVGGAGWTLREAEAKVVHMIQWKDADDAPPFDYAS